MLRSTAAFAFTLLAVYDILAFGCWLHLKRAFEQVVSNKLIQGNVLKVVKVTLDYTGQLSVDCVWFVRIILRLSRFGSFWYIPSTISIKSTIENYCCSNGNHPLKRGLHLLKSVAVGGE